jgi:hypothetical protein
MVHQVMLPVTYFSAPTAIHFVAIPVHPALRPVINFTIVDTCKRDAASSVAASLWRLLMQHGSCNFHKGGEECHGKISSH